ncbi:MAG TPA: hypothetical protein PKC30_05625 [Saprospiraceae bacterium]|nr:hypothetical protein [Saprospiraceae bacterium]
MRGKYKMTGCARFFIFLLFFAPIAYIAGSYIKGEDGIENIKHLLGIGKQVQTEESEVRTARSNNLDDIIRIKDKEIEILKKRIEELEKQLDQ